MFELHSNYTNLGRPIGYENYRSADKAWHETVEITHGLTSIMELGVYLFTSEDYRSYQPAWVGNHLRWRIRNPEKWKTPVGLSLSLEAGYQRRQYADDNWSLEIRPVIDREWKHGYVAFNPVIDYAFKGLNHEAGLSLSPQLKVSYNIKKRFQPGIEYYGSLGAIKRPDPLSMQQNQLGITLDLDISPKWEFNCGYLIGLTPTVEKGIIKVIIGRRTGNPKK
jgi:hypothetical protein